MATLEQMERALVNAHNAGDADAARVLAAAIKRARAEPVYGGQIPGAQVAEARNIAPEPGMLQKVAGAGEAALTVASGATTGLLGAAAGTAKQLGTEILSGRFGTREAARAVEEAAASGMQAGTYMPRTQAGQDIAGAIGQVASSLPAVIAPAMAPGSGMRAAGQAVRGVAPIVQAGAQVAAQRAGQGARRAGAAVSDAAQSAGRAVGIGGPEIVSDTTGGAAMSRGSVGAAGTGQAIERRTTAEIMPVPFSGKSQLTAGQASRDFAQLQFEKEAAKLGDTGQPLRERVQNQTATFIQNFDAMIDLPQPLATEPRAMGQSVDAALRNRFEVMRRKVRGLYDKAREDGAMGAPIELSPLAGTLDNLSRYEGVSPNISAVRKEAARLGIVAQDENGASVARPATIDNAELLRQFVNESTDWTDARQSMFAKRINASIDQATEDAGGAAYRAARKARRELADEFENVGLTSKLVGTKRGTTERQVALEDVFDKVIVLSPVEEMNKLRTTLLRGGPEGRQAWADLKAGGIRYIKDASLSPSQRDAAGNPLLSPDKLQRTVRAMDEAGKLESLYGKKQAQILRDLADLSTVIYTAPPGAINTSNTASALLMLIDTVGTAALTGLPAPAVTATREALKHVKNRKVKMRIEAALQGKVTKD
jgi:hypothetical protein